MWPSEPTYLDQIGATVRYPADKFRPAKAKMVDGGLFGDTPHPSDDMALVDRRYGYLEIAPGVLTVRWSRHSVEDHPDAGIHGTDCDCDHCQAFDDAGTCPGCGCDGGLCEDCEESAPVSRIITEFSHRSKVRMMRYIASVDWAAMRYPDENLLFLDLTYPKHWRACVPTPADAQRHLKAFAERFHRATGRRLRCVWVREFQSRGAPHFHLLVLWPKTIQGELSKFWLSRTWYEVVGSGDPLHLLAGTRVNHKEALAGAVDPKRAAAYFAGYCEKDKAYQHVAPEDWTNPNGSVGGFWGHRGLTKAVAEVALTPDTDTELRRLMRRYIRSQKRTATRAVARQVQTRLVNVDTGQTITPTEHSNLTAQDQVTFMPVKIPKRFRQVQRRWRLKSLTPTGPAADGERGFMVFVNDAPLLAVQLARQLHGNNQPWPKGQPRPLP